VRRARCFTGKNAKSLSAMRRLGNAATEGTFCAVKARMTDRRWLNAATQCYNPSSGRVVAYGTNGQPK
jgi:hypothetical protein